MLHFLRSLPGMLWKSTEHIPVNAEAHVTTALRYDRLRKLGAGLVCVFYVRVKNSIHEVKSCPKKLRSLAPDLAAGVF